MVQGAIEEQLQALEVRLDQVSVCCENVVMFPFCRSLRLKSLIPQTVLWGSLFEKRLAAICRLVSAICPPCVRMCLPCVCLECVRYCVRFGRVSKPCPPCVRLESALTGRVSKLYPCVRLVSAMSAVCPACCPLWVWLGQPPNLVRFVSFMCPPCARPAWPPLVRHVFANVPASHVSVMCPLFARHVPTLCQHRSTMCPLKPWPRLWTLSALGLLWGRAVASSSKIKIPSQLHARWSVSLAFILAAQTRPLQALRMLEKLFGSMLDYILIPRLGEPKQMKGQGPMAFGMVFANILSWLREKWQASCISSKAVQPEETVKQQNVHKLQRSCYAMLHISCEDAKELKGVACSWCRSEQNVKAWIDRIEKAQSVRLGNLLLPYAGDDSEAQSFFEDVQSSKLKVWKDTQKDRFTPSDIDRLKIHLRRFPFFMMPRYFAGLRTAADFNVRDNSWDHQRGGASCKQMFPWFRYEENL